MLHRSPPRQPPKRPVGAGSLRATYRGLRRMGWSEAEAGNMAAHLAGLAATSKGWHIRELEGLLFIRALVERGRIRP